MKKLIVTPQGIKKLVDMTAEEIAQVETDKANALVKQQARTTS
jgi:hypothetical protein